MEGLWMWDESHVTISAAGHAATPSEGSGDAGRWGAHYVNRRPIMFLEQGWWDLAV